MKCYVQPCIETELLEEHHIIPQARGGTKMWTIHLCPNHHDKAHNLAKSKINLEDIINLRLRKVVRVIRLATAILPHADNWNITISIPTALNNRIGADAKDKGTSKQRVILNILLKHYIKAR